MPEWISAWAGVGGAVLALIGFVWGRADIRNERSEREASDARAQAMVQTMQRMTEAAETMASKSSTPAQVSAAATQARNAIRWRIRQVDRASNRVVYELTNAGSDAATGVTVTVPDDYHASPLLHKLPVDAIVHPHEGVRFYLELRLSVVPMSSLRVVWDGGDEVVPITTF